MRIDIVKTKVYKFDELPEDAKEKALEKLYDINVNYDWYEFTYEDAKQVGLIIEEFDIDRGSYCRGKFTESAESTAQLIIDNHGIDCETYKTAQAYLKERDEVVDIAERDENGEFEDENALDDKLDELDAEFKKSIFQDYLIILRKEYEYQSSEEAIKETIEANDYEFTIEGNIYR
jgi:hypothetical protein